MSSSDNPSQDDTPRQRGDRSPSTPQQSPNIIEFVDSQDPNARSAIQRHTAYHSAAQRRDTRSRLLRRSSQARYLEWTRRPRTDADVVTSSASSASSLSISPAPSQHERSEQPTRASSIDRETSSETVSARRAAGDVISPVLQRAVSLSAEDERALTFRKYQLLPTYLTRKKN
jgi:hypothetical protein